MRLTGKHVDCLSIRWGGFNPQAVSGTGYAGFGVRLTLNPYEIDHLSLGVIITEAACVSADLQY